MRIVLAGILLTLSSSTHAQMRVEGPVCVIPGIAYQYSVHASQDSSFTLCVAGGIFETGENCSLPGIKKRYFLITWKDTAIAKVELHVSGNVVSTPVNITSRLSGGKINAGDTLKIYDGATSLFRFECSAATGGNCNPLYLYQWQYSKDGVHWGNISGANDKDLLFNRRLSVSTQFRRLTVESGSNTSVYSDIAQVVVE